MNNFFMRYAAITACLIGLFMAQPAQAQLGIAAGANFDELGDIESDNRKATFDNATGYHVGLFYDLAVGPLAVRPGVFYMDLGEFDPSFDESIGVDPEAFGISLIEVPIDARLRLATLPFVKPYLLGGPAFRFASSSDDDFDEQSLNDFSVAANVGLGLEIGLPVSNIRIFPELRYAFGVSRFVDDFEFQGADFSTDEGSNLSSFMLRLGISF